MKTNLQVTLEKQRKQDGIHSQRPMPPPPPPRRFLYLRETQFWRCEGGEGEEGGEEGEEGGEEEEKVSLLTHTTARGMGKKIYTNYKKM